MMNRAQMLSQWSIAVGLFAIGAFCTCIERANDRCMHSSWVDRFSGESWINSEHVHRSSEDNSLSGRVRHVDEGEHGGREDGHAARDGVDVDEEAGYEIRNLRIRQLEY